MTNGEYALVGVTDTHMRSRSSTIIDNEDLMATKRKRDVTPVHPGEIIQTEFLEPLGLSVSALARAIKVPCTRLNDVVRGRRGITSDTAMRLARYFGVSAQFWMNLQSHYELEVAEESYGARIEREIQPRAA
jgi:addiction module HigA family antidote